MSTIKTTSITHGSNSGTANIVLSSAGNLEARKVNGCERIILEQFFCPCDGSVIATANGNITIVDKDDNQALTTSYADVLGSTIAYNPPTGTTQVIYEYHFYGIRIDDDNPVAHMKFWIDSDEVTEARTNLGGNYFNNTVTFKWGINIGGSAVTATGRQASWSSAKTLKLTARDYGSSNDAILNQTHHWDGANGIHFHRPQIGITAIG